MTAGALVLKDLNLDRYIGELRRYPLLTREEELALALRYHQDGDVEAARALVLGNLRFVVKIAHEYRGYSFALLELVQEGNIGLMTAVKKFDPTKGYRLISYAVWWIRAYMQSFILRSWSMVKLGTTQAKRKLFFKLRSTRARLEGEGQDEEGMASQIAADLDVSLADVHETEARLAGRDFSLDSKLEADSGTTFLERVRDPEASPEEKVAAQEEHLLVSNAVSKAMDKLSEREQQIIVARFFDDEPKTLQEVGDTYKISRERIRQLESRALQKIKNVIQESVIPA